MDEVVKTFLELYPYAVWIVLAIIVTWLVSNTYHKAKNAQKKAEETSRKINQLPCDLHREKLSSQEIAMRIIESLPCDTHSQRISNLDALNGKVDVILGLMQGQSNLNFVQRHSPLALTESGKYMALELEMEKYIDQNWDAIARYIESNAGSPMNPYDIQQLCFNYVLENPVEVLTESGYNKLKVKAFNLGTSSAGL